MAELETVFYNGCSGITNTEGLFEVDDVVSGGSGVNTFELARRLNPVFYKTKVVMDLGPVPRGDCFLVADTVQVVRTWSLSFVISHALRDTMVDWPLNIHESFKKPGAYSRWDNDDQLV